MDLQFRSHLPIAQLQPTVEASGSYVRGIVTLIWPYSSSNQSISILLVEPDFRLRRYRGQVRVSFKGACAKAVAKSGLTSGDEVLVGLLGAELVHEDIAVRPPGRGVDWELQFGRRFLLQVGLFQEPILQLLIGSRFGVVLESLLCLISIVHLCLLPLSSHHIRRLDYLYMRRHCLYRTRN